MSASEVSKGRDGRSDLWSSQGLALAQPSPHTVDMAVGQGARLGCSPSSCSPLRNHFCKVWHWPPNREAVGVHGRVGGGVNVFVLVSRELQAVMGAGPTASEGEAPEGEAWLP